MTIDIDRMKLLLESKRLELRKSLIATSSLTGQPQAVDYQSQDEEESAIDINKEEDEWLVRQNEVKLLDEVEDALKRIEQGTYGFCIHCKQPIPPARLAAIPWAARDIACQEQQEEKEAQETQVMEENYLPPAMGCMQ